MYYLVNEWSLDDERLRKDLEQIGLPIQSLQLENILDSIFFQSESGLTSAYDQLSVTPVLGSVCEWGYCF